jgi:hypothetical protein
MNPWFSIARDAMRLGIESQSVVALRLARFARAGKFDWAEAQRMMSEKTETLARVQVATAMSMLSGQAPPVLARQAIGIYGKRVRHNRRRLSGG